jgi:crotonobetaine/carnitine-CoA ligase
VEGQVKPEDVSMLVYTSGTTGNPKGVMITHQMYAAAGQGFAAWTGSTSEDRFFTCLPYYHANSQYYSTMGSLAAGASLVLVDRFSATRFWDQVRDSRATVVNFIGMMMPVLLKQPPTARDRENSVRLFYGSPALAPELLSEFEGRFGARVLIGFGLTETCYGTIERLGEVHRAGSSGKVRWHPDPRFLNQLRIVDGGKEVPAGTVGEITLSNPAVMPGYWRDPARTEEALRDGWLYTGDLGRLDEEGHLYFVDRKKDVVRRRGENISSQEVEDVIKRHPRVLDCAVIAVPSELGEDEVKAYVVPRSSLTPEEVVYWCAERLAYFKVPRYVELRQDFPRTPTLRVRKDLLRQEREDLTSGCFDRDQAGIKLR